MGAGRARAEDPDAKAQGGRPPSSGSVGVREPSGASPDALVLLVGCPAELVTACREAGDRLDVTVHACDPGAMHAAAASARPFVVLMMEDLYRRDPAAIDALTHQTSVLRLEPEDMGRVDAPRLLAEAILEAVASRIVNVARPNVL